MPAARRGRRVPGEPDTDDLGGAARVERWFLRVMSVVAWLSLVLAELGQFRMALLGLLLTLGAYRAEPAGLRLPRGSG